MIKKFGQEQDLTWKKINEKQKGRNVSGALTRHEFPTKHHFLHSHTFHGSTWMLIFWYLPKEKYKRPRCTVHDIYIVHKHASDTASSNIFTRDWLSEFTINVDPHEANVIDLCLPSSFHAHIYHSRAPISRLKGA